MTNRLDAVRARLGALKLDALLITTLPNVRYLCGFSGSAGTLLVTEESAVFFTDGRYQEQAGHEVTGCEIDVGVGSRTAVRVGERVRALGIGRLGVEAESMTLAQHRRLRKEIKGCRTASTGGVVEALRRIKDADEIALLREAAGINDRVFEVACRSLREGITERQVARIIRDAIEALGGEDTAFDTIVLFGPRSSLPHGTPGDAALRYRDIVLMDFGARVAGYHGDITRTVVFGEPPAAFEARYAAVLAAQQRVTNVARPGMACEDLDAVARSLLDDAGYGEAFMHGTGHGVGLEIHESPRVGPGSDTVLQPGNVITNEPGIYIPEWGGIRIEDMLHVMADGAERLTRAPLQLVVV